MVGKEFEMVEGNYFINNTHFKVKEFATTMEIEIAFLISIFHIRIISPVKSRYQNSTTPLHQN